MNSIIITIVICITAYFVVKYIKKESKTLISLAEWNEIEKDLTNNTFTFISKEIKVINKLGMVSIPTKYYIQFIRARNQDLCEQCEEYEDMKIKFAIASYTSYRLTLSFYDNDKEMMEHYGSALDHIPKKGIDKLRSILDYYEEALHSNNDITKEELNDLIDMMDNWYGVHGMK